MSEVLREDPAPGVALLRINRPESLNALNMAAREAIAKETTKADSDPNVRVIVVTGIGRAFAAGADLKELRARTVLDAEFAASRAAWAALERCRKPLIAAVNGFAFGGGCELALHCDIVLAGESAQFGFREVRLGIMPGAGGTQRLLRVAGHFKAARYLLTGDTIDARTGSEIGMVSEVVPDDVLIERAVALAEQIAALPPLAVEAIKEALQLGADVPLQTALAVERKSFQLLFASEDREEGIAAFMENRKPNFKGK
jgi:enoyl-CoA hydratase/carnithine racemase